MPSRHLSSSSKSSSSGLFIIAVILTVTVVATFLVFYLLFRLRRARTILVHSHSSRPAPRRFPYAHLHAATHAFSPRNAIGKGASATVYRGVLPCGKSVALKFINPAASSSALAEFSNVFRVIAGIASPYITLLLDYLCEEQPSNFGDVKPSYVLPEMDFKARISNFRTFWVQGEAK